MNKKTFFRFYLSTIHVSLLVLEFFEREEKNMQKFVNLRKCVLVSCLVTITFTKLMVSSRNLKRDDGLMRVSSFGIFGSFFRSFAKLIE
jgi:hypothetical protein